MDQTRRARIESVILEEVSILLTRQIKDPRVPPMAVTRVELTQDAGLANIFVTPLSQSVDAIEWEKDRKAQCMLGLQSVKGFVRKHLAKALTIRQVPEVAFHLDFGLQNAVRVHELLKTIGEAKPQSDS